MYGDHAISTSCAVNMDSNPPFLPLEELNNTNKSLANSDYNISPDVDAVPSETQLKRSASMNGAAPANTAMMSTSSSSTKTSRWKIWNNISTAKRPKITSKKIVSFVMFSLVFIVIWDSLFTAPENRLLKPELSHQFLGWVQLHPTKGLLAFLIAIAVAVILMIPIGTPLTLGCGYIYKGAYGWRMGLTIATAVSMGGSALGAVVCFLLGRYLMRDQVRQWTKLYPLFGAIDVAAAEHGLRIMAMLYLTPILPLGPVSYMCGTTSMALSSFIMAKAAALPLMLLYVFIGASTGALIGGGTDAASDAAARKEMEEIEGNETLIVSGIVLSFVMITLITRYIRKELHKILDAQKKHKPGEMEQDSQDIEANTDEAALEMGLTKTKTRQRRAA